MVNTIVLAGNVVADPEIRNTTTNKVVATVRLAVNNPINDNEVLYINVDTWDKQAEFVQKFVKKGSSLTTCGRLKQQEWTGKDGVKRTSYCVVADKINFIGGKKKEADPSTPTVAATVAAPKVVTVPANDKEPFDDIQF